MCINIYSINVHTFFIPEHCHFVEIIFISFQNLIITVFSIEFETMLQKRFLHPVSWQQNKRRLPASRNWWSKCSFPLDCGEWGKGRGIMLLFRTENIACYCEINTFSLQFQRHHIASTDKSNDRMPSSGRQQPAPSPSWKSSDLSHALAKETIMQYFGAQQQNEEDLLHFAIQTWETSSLLHFLFFLFHCTASQWLCKWPMIHHFD